MNARRRHVPQRSCIACKSKTAKRDLLRIVAKPDGGIAFDSGGKLSGRGAYLCAKCAAKPQNIRKGRLEHTLRTKIANEEWQAIKAELTDYTASLSQAQTA